MPDAFGAKKDSIYETKLGISLQGYQSEKVNALHGSLLSPFACDEKGQQGTVVSVGSLRRKDREP